VDNVCAPTTGSNYHIVNDILTVSSTHKSTDKPHKYSIAPTFTLSFWFRMSTHNSKSFRIAEFDVSDGTVTNTLLSVSVAGNALEVELFAGKTQTNKLVLESFESATSERTWTYIAVSVDLKTNALRVYVYYAEVQKSRVLSNTSKSNSTVILKNNSYITDSLGSKSGSYHFEISTIGVNPNWFPTDTSSIEQYRKNTKQMQQCLHGRMQL